MTDTGEDNLALNLSDENDAKNNDKGAIELNELTTSPEENSNVPDLKSENGSSRSLDLESENSKNDETRENQKLGNGEDKGLPGPTSFRKVSIAGEDENGNAGENSNHDGPNNEESNNIKLSKSGNLDQQKTNFEKKAKNGDLGNETKTKADKISKESPFKKAFLISRYLTFWWMQSLFSIGNKKILEPDDVFDIYSKDKTDFLTDNFEREWNKEAYDEEGKLNQDANLMNVIFRVYGFKYMFIGIPALTMEAFRIGQSIFLGFVTSYFAPKSIVSSRDAYLYGLGLILCIQIGGWHNTPLNFIRQKFGMRARVALSGLVYKKVLRLSNSALASTTTGHIVNLVSVDVQKLDFAALFLHYLWIGPVVVVVSGYLMWREIGPSCLAGIGLLFLLAPAQMAMGRLLMKFRREVVKFTDQRVKIINEIITGIRVIKLYAWEESFMKVVDTLRMKEIRAIRKISFLRATFMSFFFSSASLVSFVTFMTYVLVGNTLTARKVFTCVSLFNGARLVMTLLFPLAITLLNESRVSVERIQKLLLMDELKAPGMEKSNLRPKSEDSKISVENLKASWTKDATTLEDITLTVGQGQLTAIIGPVGSGKVIYEILSAIQLTAARFSALLYLFDYPAELLFYCWLSSLLMAILGELPAENGSVNTVGRVAYVSQEAWIFNGSLKNNITFGQKLDEKRYQKVLEICALQRDIELFPQGDLTLVGERGVSLSGGQKARVNLARAVYFDADVYVLDDPLSAVDAHVGRHLFDKCINGYLSSKARILVTHQLQYLADADEILVLSEGKTMAKGTYHNLKSSGIDFMNLLRTEEDDVESDLDEETIRKRSFSRQLSLPHDVRSRAGSRQRRVSQVSIVSSAEDIGSDLSIASNSAKVQEFAEKQIPNEKKYKGGVTYKSYLNFFRAGHGLFVWGLLMLLFGICQAVYVAADWWLSYWTTQQEKQNKQADRDKYLGIYGALVAALLFLGITRALLFFVVILKSSKVLHGQMLRAALRAPIRFFDTNSVGRILNRFSKDISLVDDMFSFVFFDFLQLSLVVSGIVLLVCINNPVVFALAGPIVVGFFFLRHYYIKTAREVKRIEGLNRSPVFGHFSTTLLGLPIIRAFQVQQKFTDFYFHYQDDHTKTWVSFLGCGAWLAFRLELLTISFTAFAVFMSIAMRDKLGLTSGQVGLMLAYTINLVGVFQQCVRQSTEVENHMTSVERVLEYSELESEAPPETETKPPDHWPRRGSIRFKNMSFSYAPNMPNVLKGVTAHIRSNEKVGICGRTGAGKSSLLSTLFRTSEPKGSIFIDDVNVLEIGLFDLRSKLSIIPQDPVLFSGSMRRNLDPFTKYEDIELWNALEEVQMKDAVEALPGKLSSEMAEAGQNLSVGQRQLVCLARAILKRNKILVIDEATANVDPITDNLIQSTIREKFKDCTVLTIAHRLNTIMDSDRIMVLDAGRVKEFDEPYTLLKRKNSVLHQLVEQTGSGEAQSLFDVARKAFEARHNTSKRPDSAIEHEGNNYNVTIKVSDDPPRSLVGKNVELTLRVDHDNAMDNTAL